MRRLADAERIDKLLRALGKEAREETRIYLVGGATMVLNGLRGTTVEPERDDLRIEPELYRYPAIDPATFRRAAEEAFRKDLEA